MMPVLIDTSAWVSYFREKDSTEGEIIDGLIEDTAVCTTGIVVAKLVAGAKNNRDKSKLEKILRTLPFLNITEPLWWKAVEYRWKIRLDGFTDGLPDTIISAAAIHFGAQLFTLDSHFDHIAEFIPLDLFK